MKRQYELLLRGLIIPLEKDKQIRREDNLGKEEAGEGGWMLGFSREEEIGFSRLHSLTGEAGVAIYDFVFRPRLR